ncbi:Quinone oxidoreductase [Candidatus Methylacidithermus pantelleriae]|uniref:Quinone oxidoreductase n=1 Tax=Candidatus Methylacidithermus pantelleriae TaxID=2744239 RepID=A0A8J2FV69_9BACT|nr:Quinone oxidoreductase [Candidatus Methylacidithermus pantelleriae]
MPYRKLAVKAIIVRRLGQPEVMTLEELPDPVPGEGEVLVRIHAAGVNPVDTYLRGGQFGYSPELPFTPGIDGAGVVEQTGPKVTKVKAGDRVYLAGSRTGTYAELAVASESQVYPLPPSISFAEGACLYVPYGTAYRALFVLVSPKPGETLLVHGGSGGVGLAAIQWASAFGLRVAATASTEEGRSLVLRNGAQAAWDHTDPSHWEKAVEWTGGVGFGIVLEMLANVNLARDLDIIRTGGRVIVVGCRGESCIDPRKLMAKDGGILGLSLANASPQELEGFHLALEAGLSRGFVRPHIRAILPLSQAPKAHRMIWEPGALGKIVLVP